MSPQLSPTAEAIGEGLSGGTMPGLIKAVLNWVLTHDFIIPLVVAAGIYLWQKSSSRYK